MSQPIQVTKPYLPPLSGIVEKLEAVWDSKIITNEGPYAKQLEAELAKYLQVPYISLVSSGTVGLMLALKAADIKGEVLTTPYSFVATSNVLRWCNLQPKFVDITPSDLNIDPEALEQAISPQTSAILAVHTYGNPCDVDQLADIAQKNGLKLIYDGCHSFGVRHHGRSLLNNGDFSVVSFHATKVFNIFEGGAVISRTQEGKQKIDRLRNFGFESEIEVEQCGINGKVSEFNAVVGLEQLKYIDKAIADRMAVDKLYRANLRAHPKIRLIPQSASDRCAYPYFPILILDNTRGYRDKIVETMRESNINVRRYFYPLISELKAYAEFTALVRKSCKTAYEASNMVICLPIYPELSPADTMLVIDTLKKALDGKN